MAPLVSTYTAKAAPLYQPLLSIGSIHDDFGSAIDADQLGNVFVVGRAEGLLGYNYPRGSGPTINGDQAFLTKLSENGDYLWTTHFGGSGADTATDVLADQNGGAIVSWCPRCDRGVGSNSRIERYGNAGQLEWSLSIGSPENSPAITALVRDSSESFYAAGSYLAQAKREIYFAKLSNDGLLLSERTIEIPESRFEITDMQSMPDGSLVIAGQDLEDDIIVRSISANGDLQWTSRIGGYYEHTTNSVAVGQDGTVYVGGTTRESSGSAFRLAAFDSEGSLLWDKKGSYDWLRPSQAVQSVMADGEGGVIAIRRRDEAPDYAGDTMRTETFVERYSRDGLLIDSLSYVSHYGLRVENAMIDKSNVILGIASYTDIFNRFYKGNQQLEVFRLDVFAVPEPSSTTFCCSLLTLSLARRRRSDAA